MGLPDSTARARELGAELRHARETIGLSGVEMARRLGWSHSKVSRMESGQRSASEVDTAIYLSSCGVARAELERLLELARQADDGYWVRPHGQALPDELRSLVIQESTATSITSFELSRINGLLQTEEYARALLYDSPLESLDDIELRVEARMARQSLLRRYRPPRLLFYVHEQALRLPVGGARVMHEQVLQLVFTTSLSHCSVRVVPTAAGAHPGLAGPFFLMRYDEHQPVVYVENETASVFLETPEDISTYRRILARLAEVALDEGQSREWLAELASEYDRAEDGSRCVPASTPV
ncbi:helix-turn-helix domain-containing protein [Haloechinothrix sp. YIM 98757]|uniref:Helix-turn-helix domain-containing protein n=1 Tax=Haloechinothrix aidingensis TaxID=2752311 RepID=A0A838AF18_9PSEU|nr:helix-turn-helix transcriptional regulator [Haloechinothrix aidingensis]MBA0127718.1 helix-turn-helix domain-containing protein [Haloechinothrix aidingensis]